MPDGELVELFYEVALGDHIVAFGVGYGQRGQNGVPRERRIVGWYEGERWVVGDNRWFKGPAGEELYLSPSPVVAGNEVAFTVGAGYYSEVWVADGCTISRVARSGDRVGGKQIRNFAGLDRESFSGGQLRLVANFTDGSQGFVRAHKP